MSQAQKHLVVISNIVQHGVRLGDELVIFPPDRKRSVRALNRTCFHLATGIKKTNVDIPLFHLGAEEFSCELRLIEAERDEERRYILRSLSPYPFKINGNYSFYSYVERGDVVVIGHSKILFRKKMESMRHQECAILGDERLIQSNMSILLTGETGIGKSHLAKDIHQLSGRVGPFVHINLSALASGLIESELFGHVKGAFTGAEREKKGAILQAQDGTLFLDEVDSISLALQTKLLLFFDTKEVRPVGGEFIRKSNARLILASGRNLRPLVEVGKMRRDFFFRLTAGFQKNLAPLRERPTFLLEHIRLFEQEHDVTFAAPLVQFYQSLPWPGNLRQFLGHLRKKKEMSRGRKIDFDNLDDELICKSSELGSLESDMHSLKEIKENYAYRVYERLEKDIRACASVLKISDRTVRNLLKKKLNTQNVV